jgi:monoamine oxidase
VKSPYWEDDGIEASMWTDGPFTLIRQQLEYDGKRELISALSFGKRSQEVDRLSAAERGQLAINYIEKVRPSARGKIEFLGVHSWAMDPLVRGCSHAFLPWRGAAWSQSMSLPHHQLHFAGEHTRRLEVGMEAAMESGERAALEILEALA